MLWRCELREDKGKEKTGKDCCLRKSVLPRSEEKFCEGLSVVKVGGKVLLQEKKCVADSVVVKK